MTKKILTTVLTLFICAVLSHAQVLKIATYNIRLDAKSDVEQGDGWQQRKVPLTQLIRFHDFDIFGSQEVLKNQLDDMLTQLPDYSFTGVGRDDGAQKGEYSPIFYKKDKFKLLKNGTFWLSENTVEPNKGWDAVLPRICSWGLFQDKKTKKKFMFFNTHFDHRGVNARLESSKLILNKIKELAGNKFPVILTGDFNVDQLSDSYKILHDSEILEDAYETSDIRYALNGTFNGFNINTATMGRIDHIFLTRQFKVKRYGVLTDNYRIENISEESFNPVTAPSEMKLHNSQARLPSDHYPVMIVAEF